MFFFLWVFVLKEKTKTKRIQTEVNHSALVTVGKGSLRFFPGHKLQLLLHSLHLLHLKCSQLWLAKLAIVREVPSHRACRIVDSVRGDILTLAEPACFSSFWRRPWIKDKKQEMGGVSSPFPQRLRLQHTLCQEQKMVIGHPCPPCPSPKGDFVQRRSHIYGTGDHPRSSLLGGHRWTLGSRNFLFYAKDLASLIFKQTNTW